MRKKVGILFLVLAVVILPLIGLFIYHKLGVYIKADSGNTYFSAEVVFLTGVYLSGLFLLLGVIALNNHQVSRWLLGGACVIALLLALLLIIDTSWLNTKITIALYSLPAWGLLAFVIFSPKRKWMHGILIGLVALATLSAIGLAVFVFKSYDPSLKDDYVQFRLADDLDKPIIRQVSSDGSERKNDHVLIYCSLLNMNIFKGVYGSFRPGGYTNIADGTWNEYSREGILLRSFEVKDKEIITGVQKDEKTAAVDDIPEEEYDEDTYIEDEDYESISYLDGQFYRESSLPKQNDCVNTVIEDSTQTLKINLFGVKTHQFQTIARRYGVEEVDSVNNYFTVKEGLFASGADSLLYKGVLNRNIEQVDYIPKLTYLREAYGNAFYEDGLSSEYDKLQFLVSNMSREKGQVMQLFNRYEELLYCLIPEELYKESAMHLYVRTLLYTYEQLHCQEEDYNALMTRFYDLGLEVERVGWEAEERVFSEYEPYIDDIIHERFESTQLYLDSRFSRTVQWFYSFWARRHHEGNDEVVHEILQRINAHYSGTRSSEAERPG